MYLGFECDYVCLPSLLRDVFELFVTLYMFCKSLQLFMGKNDYKCETGVEIKLLIEKQNQ